MVSHCHSKERFISVCSRLSITIFLASSILLSCANPVFADNNKPGSNLGNISTDVYPERVNSTRDLEDKDPGDGKCSTGETNCLDQTECTLRAFIQEANSRKGKDRIDIIDIPTCESGYNSESHVHTISPKSPLPAITDPAEIEGCPPGSEGCLPSIELNGSRAGGNADGLKITSGNSTVSGLIINGFKGAGIVLSGKGENVIKGNYIGTDYEGTSPVGNSLGGIVIDNSYDNVIGGSSENEINLISGNGVAGVVIKGENSVDNKVTGNYIGTSIDGDCRRNAEGLCSKESSTGNLVGVLVLKAADNNITENLVALNKQSGVLIVSSPSAGNNVRGNLIGISSGFVSLPNGDSGVEVRGGGGNTIGGASEIERNIISGNASYGVALYNSKANKILGNYIGVGIHGITDYSNGGDGVLIKDGQMNTVGGVEQGSGNIISGNKGSGVKIIGVKSEDNRVLGNKIGNDWNGLFPVPNQADGVHIEDASGNHIGGAEERAANVISGNKGSGIFLKGKTAKGNRLEGNYIGTAGDGDKPLANEIHGIHIVNAPQNIIGGSGQNSGNLISCNDNGIYITGAGASGNRVERNFIGTKKGGKSIIECGIFTVGSSSYLKTGNHRGILIQSPENTVGGSQNQRNVISGNTYEGVVISAIFSGEMEGGYIRYTDVKEDIAHGNKIQSNFIGVDVNGAAPLPNGMGAALVSASGNLIGGSGKGNVISGNTGNGIFIVNNDSAGNRIEGNFIGTDAKGTSRLGNEVGIEIDRAQKNVVGGTGAASRNIISGNKNQGILVTTYANDNRIEGNFIGTDVNGTSPLGNGIGIAIEGSQKNMVGVTPNIISGNERQGIIIERGAENVVRGNYIGTDADTKHKIGNETGIEIIDSSNNTIGGDEAKEGNIILSNRGSGVIIRNNSNGNRVQGNFIGTDATGSISLGNEGSGIEIDNSNDNIVGIDPNDSLTRRLNESNTIAYNSRVGVRVKFGQRNRISLNSIFDNEGSGIVLTAANADHSFNPPVLKSAKSGLGLVIKAAYQIEPFTELNLEFFSNPQCVDGKGQGKKYLGSMVLGPAKYQGFSYSSRLRVPSGHFITATATDPKGNTSEFSNCVAVK